MLLKPKRGRQDGLHRTGHLWENGYIESFNARLRDELLNGEIFYTPREAQIIMRVGAATTTQSGPTPHSGYKPAPETFVPTFTAGPASLCRPASPATLALPAPLN
jgi:transposase InsO family protein